MFKAGMNFGVRGSYTIVLMSTEKNAPYVDEICDGGVIKYEGHDKERIPPHQKKLVDQPMANNSGTFTQKVGPQKQQRISNCFVLGKT